VTLIYSFLQSNTQKTASVEGETVIVAQTDIPAKTRVSLAMVREVRVPPEYIQPGAIREVPKVVGTMTREAVLAGEQLTERRLLPEGRYSGFSGVIPAGKRAITVAATDVTGVAGLLRAGDTVDVLVTFDAQTVGDSVSKIAMQNVVVLAVNRDTLASQDNSAGKKEGSTDPALAKVANVTLAVSPEDAARITIAEEKGKVRFALRPYISENDTVVALPVFPTDIVGEHRAPKQSGASNPVASSSAGILTVNSIGIPVIRGTKIE
jgi:pilus assembly protein CpaB